ncbi:MAG: UDP-N-acetylmuramoyl-tripeptide--D-alanyl-D-alanine ligase, partial [Gemmatimonadales bacterium]
MRWTAAIVMDALGLHDGADPGIVFAGISTDTRRLVPGSLFVALAGERFDAHTMLPEAAASGATGAVVRVGTPP